MLKVNEQIEVKVNLLNASHVPVAGTITYTVYDEADVSFATGTMTAVAGVTGLYTMAFTPDAAGEWSVRFVCLSPTRYAVKVFSVGKGVEQDTYNAVVALNDIAAADVWTAANRALSTPNDYKADVSALALEATVSTHDTDIKALLEHGTYGLSAIETLVDEIESLLKHGTYGLSAIETLVDDLETAVGANTDEANMADSLFAGQQAIWDNIHGHVGMIVADKTSLQAGATLVKTQLEKKYQVTVLDDDDIDSGNADLPVFDVVFVCGSVTDMTKINELTALGVPLFTCNPETALTIFRMGDDGGGSGTSWDTGAAQTQINIVDITHQIFIDQSTGNFTIYSSAGEINWIRTSDLVAGAIELAEYAGDNTKSTVVVLPYDVADEDGTAAPMPRVYWGGHEPDKWNAATQTLFYNLVDWLIYQGRREVEVQGLGKINQINQKLGTELSNADNIYDYLVTGANEAGVFPAITASKTGSVLERIEYINDLLESGTYGLSAIETLVDDLETNLSTHDTALGTHDTDIKALLEHATYGLSAIETLVDDIEGKTDNLPTDPASQARIISRMDFWSEGVVTVNIPTTADQDINLPDVVVPTLPTGITVFRVEVLFKCALIKDTSASDNAIDEAGVIRIKADGDATFDGNGVDAYVIEDNKWSIDVSEATERGGDAFVGKTDIKAKVTGADTYNLRLDSVSADGTNLVLVDVCVGLRVYFY